MASEAMCRGFKSLQARQSGPLAQLVEQLTLNQRVVGSIPTRPTIYGDFLQSRKFSHRLLLC